MRHQDYGRPLPTSLVPCLVLALVIPALGPGAAAAQQIVNIDVFNFEFGNATTGQPFDPTITVGDTVRWTFVAVGHTSTSVAGIAETWNSGFLNPPATFSHTFTNVGTFHYFCIPHGVDLGNGTAGGMAGIITVQPVPEPSMVLLSAGLAGTVVCGLRRRWRGATAGT